MKYPLACLVLISGIVVATSSLAYSFRSDVQFTAGAHLRSHWPQVKALKEGRQICDTGIISFWDSIVTLVSPRGAANGLQPGDKLLKIDNKKHDYWAYVHKMSSFQPGDHLSITIERNDEVSVVNLVCGDGTEVSKTLLNMFQSALEGDWQACIDESYKYDELTGTKTFYVADLRMNCNRAKRCPVRRCEPETNQDAMILYDYLDSIITEGYIAGKLYSIRKTVRWGVGTINGMGLHSLATELNSRFKAARAGSVKTFGTCFAVSSNEVITSHHLVDGAVVITVQFQDGPEIEAVVSEQSRASDLAVLFISGQTPASLPLSPPRSANVGDQVFTIGHIGEETKFTEGSISSLTGIQGDASYLQMSVPIQPGNFGGPVANFNGEIVGVVTATAAIETFYPITGEFPQDVNWASKSDYARALFNPPDFDSQAPDRNDAIQRVRSALCKVTALPY